MSPCTLCVGWRIVCDGPSGAMLVDSEIWGLVVKGDRGLGVVRGACTCLLGAAKRPWT